MAKYANVKHNADDFFCEVDWSTDLDIPTVGIKILT